ncbi:hypothetical protein BH23ACT9_BH23ACT9_12890 [soil metagenome]
MYDGPVLDAHIHLWDPRTTPRTVSPVVKALGWNQRLMRTAVAKAVPDSTMAFVGRPDHMLAPFLPGMWFGETRPADTRGFVHIQADWQAKTPLANADEASARCVGIPVAVGGPFAGRGTTASDRDVLRGRWAEDLAAIAAHEHVP